MKLKQAPEDFHVEELTERLPTDQGPFSLYRLEKKGWATLDAVQAIRRRWHLDAGRLSYGGLKDRHAHTVQHITIYHGPRRGLTHHAVTLSYLGQTSRPFTSNDICANRFRITLRDIPAETLAAAEQALREIGIDGVPNYFDDQRFGSVSVGNDFVARQLVLGNWERALRLAIASPYAHDRAPQKQEKAILQARWGDWACCKAELSRGHARSLVDYLVSHPLDFRGAFQRMRKELSALHLSAYQSHIWNHLLAGWLQQTCRDEQLVPVTLRLEALPMVRGLDAEQRARLTNSTLPLPSARLKIDPTDPRAQLLEAILQREGFRLQDMKIKGLREPFFSKGDRPVLSIPAQFRYEVLADDRHPGRSKLVLSFELSRGAYATLLIKRIQQA